MKNMTPVRITGKLQLEVQAVEAAATWVQQVLGDTAELPASVRKRCAVASASNDAIEKHHLFDLNPKTKSTFGKDSRTGKVFLTVGVIMKTTGRRFKIRWDAESLPTPLTTIAIRHDRGWKTRPISAVLQFADASCWELDDVSDRTDNPDRVVKRRPSLSKPRKKPMAPRMCAGDLY